MQALMNRKPANDTWERLDALAKDFAEELVLTCNDYEDPMEKVVDSIRGDIDPFSNTYWSAVIKHVAHLRDTTHPDTSMEYSDDQYSDDDC